MIKNSWGSRDWGDAGYGWVDYALFQKATFVGVTVKELPPLPPEPNQPIPPPRPRPDFIVIPAAKPQLVINNWRQAQQGDDWRRVLALLGGPTMDPQFNDRGTPAMLGITEFVPWFFAGPEGETVTVTLANGAVTDVKFAKTVKNAVQRAPEKVVANWRQVQQGDDWRRVLALLGGPTMDPQFNDRGTPAMLGITEFVPWFFAGPEGETVTVTLANGTVTGVTFSKTAKRGE